MVLPATLPQGTYSLSVIANGIASDPVTFDYAGPLYVDTHFTTQNYPTGAVPDADPVLAGSQPAAIGTTAFASVNAAIAAAQPGQVIIVNGANGDTDSGVFHEAVAVNKVVEVYLQQGPVAFDSLAGTAGGASIELHGVGLTVGDDDTTTAYAGTFTGTGGLTKKGAGTLTLSSDNSGTYSGDVTITGGAIQLNNGKALANSAVTVNSNFGLAFLNTLTTATLGSLAGSGNINLLSTALTVGGNNTGTGLNPITYSGNLTGTALGSITKVGKGMWELSGNNGGYHGGWRSTPGWWRWVLNSPWPAAPSP